MSLAFLEFVIIFLTATRGAILGLFGGAVFFALLTSIFTKNKKLRYGMLVFFAFLLLQAPTMFSRAAGAPLIISLYLFSRKLKSFLSFY